MISIENVSKQVILAQLRGDFTAEELIASHPFLANFKEGIYAKYKAERRRYEVLTERLLLHKLFCQDSEKVLSATKKHHCCVVLGHNTNGSPRLSNGYNISISHTKGCVAVIVSPCQRVSIDVEYISERVNRITSKFIRDDEEAPTLLHKLLHWCAKETIYKLYSADDLGLKDIRLLSINGDEESGEITAENIKAHEQTAIKYRVADSIVMTYSVIQANPLP